MLNLEDEPAPSHLGAPQSAPSATAPAPDPQPAPLTDSAASTEKPASFLDWSKDEKWFAAAILVAFIGWLVAYFVFIRPVINSFLFRFVSSYPAGLHLIPIIGIPLALLLLWTSVGPRGRGAGIHPS